MHCLAEDSKKIIMVGIPGVGKSTLVAKIVEILKSRQKSVSVNSFGTLMFEEAQKIGIKDRDELRKLSMDEQKNLQKKAAEKIAKLEDDLVIIDTHAFIITNAGFYPGLPHHVLEIIAMLSSCAVYSGSPMKPVFNTEGKVDEAANTVISAIEI